MYTIEGKCGSIHGREKNNFFNIRLVLEIIKNIFPSKVNQEIIKILQNTPGWYFGYDEKVYKNRQLLVDIGTSMRAIDPNVWVNCLRRQMDQSRFDRSWVVDDVRHVNELQALKEMGFTVIRIDIPEAVRKQRVKETYPDTYEEHLHVAEHSSEQELCSRDNLFDQIIPHDQSRHNMDMWLRETYKCTIDPQR